MNAASVVFFFLLLVVPLQTSSAFTLPFASRMSRRSSQAPSLSRLAAAAATDGGSPLSVGLVGCGTIASAIATGLATQDDVPLERISVSRRSEERSSALAETFPDIVTVFDDNQDVVDRSDLVFICLLPEQTSEILQGLTFDDDRHKLVSLVSTSNLESLVTDTGLSAERIYKMICLPSVANHEGVCLLTPKNDDPVLLPLFESLGGCVQAADERQMSAMMVSSGLMGSMYGILRNNREWLMKNGGVSKEDATYLVSRFYYSMLQDADRQCRNPEAFDDLIAEQTPGGLNEQALGNVEKLGVMDALDDVQDALYSRIQGQSDGFLPPKG